MLFAPCQTLMWSSDYMVNRMHTNSERDIQASVGLRFASELRQEYGWARFLCRTGITWTITLMLLVMSRIQQQMKPEHDCFLTKESWGIRREVNSRSCYLETIDIEIQHIQVHLNHHKWNQLRDSEDQEKETLAILRRNMDWLLLRT